MNNEEKKHTGGEWRSFKLSGEEIAIYEDSSIVAIIPSCEGQDEDLPYETREANAKRIVACVNACEGILNKDLEGGVLREMVKSLKGSLGDLDAIDAHLIHTKNIIPEQGSSIVKHQNIVTLKRIKRLELLSKLEGGGE